MQPVILAIESSCDDTAAAVLSGGHILSNVTFSQEIHAKYGGVVPELASRAHQTRIIHVVREAIDRAQIGRHQLSAIACTVGPGLMGSLLVGVSFAKGLAISLDIPLIAVHHLQAHVLSPLASVSPPEFPYLCLLVSGGHTQIVRVNGPLDQEVLGTTLDDAAGEAFDKAGKLLGLRYPAGPEIDHLSRSGRPVYAFPHPRLEGYAFSFSGIKTAIRYFLRDQTALDPDFIRNHLPDICASVQHHIVVNLLENLERAATDTGLTRMALAGGVAANSHLRQSFRDLGLRKGWQTHIPEMALSTDNAAMIGLVGHFKFLQGQWADLSVRADPRLPFMAVPASNPG